MNKIIILISTYNRPVLLFNLLKQINSYSNKYNIQLIIINDGSTLNYNNCIEFLNTKFKGKFIYSELKYNQGQKNYWKIINWLYNEVRYYEFDYAYGLADDFELCHNFFDKTIELWNNIADKNKICLNPMLIEELKQQSWVTDKLDEFPDYYKSQWVDGAFICKRKYFEILNFEIFPINSNCISSGVGKQITQRLTKKYNIYMTKKSFVSHGKHDSVMHYEHRKERPLTCII